MSMNLHLEIVGIDIELRQTPTAASYKIYVEGNPLQTAKNYLEWVKSLYTEEDLQEFEQKTMADYKQAAINMGWTAEEISANLIGYMNWLHPFTDATQTVEMVEEALAANESVEFSVY